MERERECSFKFSILTKEFFLDQGQGEISQDNFYDNREVCVRMVEQKEKIDARVPQIQPTIEDQQELHQKNFKLFY